MSFVVFDTMHASVVTLQVIISLVIGFAPIVSPPLLVVFGSFGVRILLKSARDCPDKKVWL